MRRIVLATRNRGKTEEISRILTGLPVELVSVLDIPHVDEPPETGTTLESNALEKARFVHRATGLPSLADDTGLEVFALDLRPGVRSARYAGEDATYDDNNRKLLGELARVPAARRGARFRCVAAFVDGSTEMTTEGYCLGMIGSAARGAGGFGYDPLFIPEGMTKTFAELSAEVKNAISHRGMAFTRMRSRLGSYLMK